MKTLLKKLLPRRQTTSAALLLTITLITAGCNKDDDEIPEPTPASLQSFSQVNLVASSASLSAGRVDAGLVNAWGIAFSPTGNPWISSTGAGTSVVYNSAGAQAIPAVTIPTHGAATGGLPTGQVFNSTTGFVLSNGSAARFIFAGLDGVISGWSSGAAALPAVDRNGVAVYTGLAIAASGANTFLYAANFTGGKVEVFNSSFVLQATTLTDPALPAGYAPFNVQNIGGLLYILYAIPDPVTHEKIGPGLGVVSVFNADGSFVKRLVTGGALNAPWGITQARSGWLTNAPGTVLLVGNFGDGHINAYDDSGKWLGTLQSGGNQITIPGLWALSFAPPTATAVDSNRLYFAAGPAAETQGLFGYVIK